MYVVRLVTDGSPSCHTEVRKHTSMGLGDRGEQHASHSGEEKSRGMASTLGV